MNDVTVIGNLFTSRDKKSDNNIQIVSYGTQSNEVTRSKVVLKNFVFSLLVEGTKVVHTSHDNITVDDNQFLMLSPGNYLMTERIVSTSKRYHVILIFFTTEAILSFFTKHPGIITASRNAETKPVTIFQKDDYLRNFIRSLDLLIANGKALPDSLRQTKFEELMLYLNHHFPMQMHRLRMEADKTEFEIQKLAESHIDSNITLSELAFLGNMSLSTFKRKFIKVYGIAPSKWFLQKRMTLAMELLRSGKEKPSEIYYKVGYESHSSFTHSFKQAFGITPSEYKEKMSA